MREKREERISTTIPYLSLDFTMVPPPYQKLKLFHCAACPSFRVYLRINDPPERLDEIRQQLFEHITEKHSELLYTMSWLDLYHECVVFTMMPKDRVVDSSKTAIVV